MRIDELVPKNKIFEQAAPNVAQIVNYLGNQNPGLKPPSVQNALTQFLNANPDLARQAAANMNAAPGANIRANSGSLFKGVLGRALGAIGLILTPTPAGEGSEYLGSSAQIAYEFQRDLLKNNPQAYVDMVNASVAAMSEVEKQQIEDGNWPDPRQSDEYNAAEEASRILSRDTTAFAPEVEPVDIPVTQPDWWPEDMPFEPEAPEGPTRDEPPVLPREDEPPVIIPSPDVPELPAKDEPPVIIPDVPEPVEVPDTTTPPVEKPKPEAEPETETPPVEKPKPEAEPETETPPVEKPKPEAEPETETPPVEKPKPEDEPEIETPPVTEPGPAPGPTPITAPITAPEIAPITAPITAPLPIRTPGTQTAPRTQTQNTPPGNTRKRPAAGGGLNIPTLKSPLLPIADPLELSRTVSGK
jgi:hypothetical protein